MLSSSRFHQGSPSSFPPHEGLHPNRISICLYSEVYLVLIIIILNETIRSNLVDFLALFADVATIAIAYDISVKINEPAMETASFTAQVIVMNRPGQIGPVTPQCSTATTPTLPARSPSSSRRSTVVLASPSKPPPTSSSLVTLPWSR
ncbi:hypothetical protein CF326_g6665 [Tilletia indica]|nr:hypothetical protein CF326_g6665 [Tilletia indica]